MSFHSFHIVEKRPWPLTGSIGALILITRIINYFHHKKSIIFIITTFIIIITIYQWWRDVQREASFQGLHTLKVTNGLKWGIILFITSEVLFFFSFFWAFFHSRLSPTIELGLSWPPTAIFPFNPFHVPLLNTSLLLASGATVTWSHYRIINNNYKNASLALFITIILGAVFSILQAWEYIEARFSISDRVYGSTFFVSTGFHGLHVIIGSLFLFSL